MKSAQIKTLTDREHLLIRPQIYIGNTNTYTKKDWAFIKEGKKYIFTVKEIPYNEGYYKLFSEILDNSIDENIKTNGKFGSLIRINLLDVNHFIIEDNGRGLPTSIMKELGKSQFEVAFTHLRAGSNFQKGTSESESDANPGMNGVGASIVNVLSDSFKVETEDESGRMILECDDNMNNVKCTKVKTTGNRGTKVEAKLSTKYFNDIQLLTKEDVKTWLYKRVLELKTFYPNITIYFNDQIVESTIFDFINPSHVLTKNGNKSIAISFKNYDDEMDMSYVNSLNTYEGGTHLSHVQNYVYEWMKKRLEKKFKPTHKLKIEDLKRKLFLCVSLTSFPNAVFSTQNKIKMINPKAEIANYIPESFMEKACLQFFDKFTSELQEMVELFEEIYIGKLARKAKNNKINVAKLIEANSKDRAKTRLHIVEGDSARMMFLQTRNKDFHAAYPLRGKILNVYEKNIKTLLDNEEVKGLLQVIGLQVGQPATNINYGQICILTDADFDGHNITSLLLILFHKFWPELFTQGKIVKIFAPFIIATKGKEKRTYYEMSDYLKEMEFLRDNNYNLSYFKGLGKMNPKEYAEMICNPFEVTINMGDVAQARRALNIMFGKDTTERKLWLQGKDILEME